MNIVSLSIVLVWIVGAIGWVWNIVKLVAVISDPLTAMVIVRAVGVFFAPLGAVLGFF